ncbi:HpcH/HpaI aldolase/citrate lyase family protein [Clostridium sp.]|uniref:HpcH/HpaI aldolase/citrate lyase family protein n=1 Tax=Clostridium sp. TaxID=1506 RepID=UPI002FC941AE
MRYFKEVYENLFYKKPEDFNKFSNKEFLMHCLGANMYMSATKDVLNKLLNKEFKNTGCITFCFEDATKGSEVLFGENNVINILTELNIAIQEDRLNEGHIPLIFLRVRNIKQFKEFSKRLNKEGFSILTGFIFPKFDSSNGEEYFYHLKKLNEVNNTIVYGMPIIESEKVIYKETRVEELLRIKEIIDNYKDYILNIRVGGTDFSSKFGLRRKVTTSIYDIKVVSDCLIDIINLFSRCDIKYAVSAPVFEYFSNDSNSKEVKGLLNEINFDIENGFTGKTVIHPSQVNFVNTMQVVSYEDYIDAENIIENASKGGVFKGVYDNKMNEVMPHLNWAKKVILRARAFGVLNERINNFDLL